MVKGYSENTCLQNIQPAVVTYAVFMKSFTDASNREGSDRLPLIPPLPVVFKKLQKQIKYLLV